MDAADDHDRIAGKSHATGRPPRTSLWKRNENFLLGLISVTLFLLFWESRWRWAGSIRSSPVRRAASSHRLRDVRRRQHLSTTSRSAARIRARLRARGHHRRAARDPDGLVPPARRAARSVRLRALCDAAHRAVAADHHLVRHRHGAKIAIIFLATVFPIVVKHDHRRAHDGARLHQGRALVRRHRSAVVLDRGAPSSVPHASHRASPWSRPCADRHRGRRDVRRDRTASAS